MVIRRTAIGHFFLTELNTKFAASKTCSQQISHCFLYAFLGVQKKKRDYHVKRNETAYFSEKKADCSRDLFRLHNYGHLHYLHMKTWGWMKYSVFFEVLDYLWIFALIEYSVLKSNQTQSDFRIVTSCFFVFEDDSPRLSKIYHLKKWASQNYLYLPLSIPITQMENKITDFSRLTIMRMPYNMIPIAHKLTRQSTS